METPLKVQSRRLGDPSVLSDLLGQLGRNSKVAPTVDPKRLGRTYYHVFTNRLVVDAPVSIVALRAVFPAALFPPKTAPRQFGWLLAQELEGRTPPIVLATRDYFGKQRPFDRLILSEHERGLALHGQLFDPKLGQYHQTQFDFTVGTDGTLVVGGREPLTPADTLMASALEFIRVVGEGIGTAQAIAAINLRYSDELDQALASHQGMRQDLSPLAPVIAAMADGLPSNPVEPLARMIHPYSPSVDAGLDQIRLLERRLQRVAHPSLAGSRTKKPDLNRYQRLAAPGGLFDSIPELNATSRALGRVNYVDWFYGGFGLSLERMHDEAMRYLGATATERQKAIAALQRVLREEPLSDLNIHDAVRRLQAEALQGRRSPFIPMPRLLKAIETFCGELGFDLTSGPMSALTFDMTARPDKGTLTQFFPLSSREGFISGAAASGAFDLIGGGQLLAHEIFHWLQAYLGSQPVKGAMLVASQDPHYWREGTADAFGALLLEPAWVRRYLTGIKGVDVEGFIALAELNNRLAPLWQAQAIGKALFEMVLYRDDLPMNERLDYWKKFRSEYLGMEGSADPESWPVWETAHYTDMPGYLGAYFIGRSLGERLMQPLHAALIKGDAKALRAAGEKIGRILSQQPWLSTEAKIEAALAAT